jgi:hypothetical protein
VIADETIGVFRKNTSLGSIDVVVVAVLGGGGGGERERGRRQAAIGRIAPKKVEIFVGERFVSEERHTANFSKTKKCRLRRVSFFRPKDAIIDARNATQL